MAASLTILDIAHLTAERTADVRAEVAGKIAADLCGHVLTAAEAKMAYDIARILAFDVEEGVRASLARGLRHAPNLPRDIACKLAHDIEFVALPMLVDSIVLTDADLIEIIRRGSCEKQEAIAGRANLDETVSDVLITHGEEPAVAVLMGNKTAAIADASFDRAVSRFADSGRVKAAMVMRERLPLAIAERLVTMVSKALQAHLVNFHDLAPETLADILMASRERAIIHLSLGTSDEDLVQMAAQMHTNARLTPSLIIRALSTGDIAFFEAAMAVRAAVPLANARILIHEASRRGLEALYEKASMPMPLYRVVRAAVEVFDESRSDGAERSLEQFRSQVISQVLRAADHAEPSDADDLLDNLWEVLIGKNVELG